MSKIALTFVEWTHETYYEFIAKRDRDTYEEMYLYIREPIWINAREIYHESDSSYETNVKVL